MVEYREQIRRFYDDFASTWDERFGDSKAFRFFLAERISRLRKHLGDDFDSIVDAGCGTGYYIMRLLQPHQKGLGFDFSEQMIGQARSVKEKMFGELSLEFEVDDGEQLSIPDNSYDRAITVGYLIHLENPKKGLDELYRILKPGGRLVGLVSNRWSPWLAVNLRKAFARNYGVVAGDHEFSPPEIRGLMEECGFKNVHLEVFNTLPGRLPNWAYYPGRVLNLAFKLWPVSLLGFHILVIGDKE